MSFGVNSGNGAWRRAWKGVCPGSCGLRRASPGCCAVGAVRRCCRLQVSRQLYGVQTGPTCSRRNSLLMSWAMLERMVVALTYSFFAGCAGTEHRGHDETARCVQRPWNAHRDGGGPDAAPVGCQELPKGRDEFRLNHRPQSVARGLRWRQRGPSALCQKNQPR
jgi:hypothetical protein